jgi:hypothetical protein
MLSKMKYVGNCCVVLFCLILGVGCGRTQVHPVPPVNDSAPYAFCESLYNVQLNVTSKEEQCNGYIAVKDQFPGFDVPGFPPQSGYCGETFGAKCQDEKDALTAMESCVALMPVCVPERADAWVEQWRHACINIYNSHVSNPDCLLKELKVYVKRRIHTPVTQDSEDE